MPFGQVEVGHKSFAGAKLSYCMDLATTFGNVDQLKSIKCRQER